MCMVRARTLQIKRRIATAANPNSMVYNAATDSLFVGHKPSQSTTVIQASKGRIVKSIPLGGVPSFIARICSDNSSWGR